MAVAKGGSKAGGDDHEVGGEPVRLTTLQGRCNKYLIK
jgi:hypothetical protein